MSKTKLSSLLMREPSTNTSDATATAADILPGKTAYASGAKLTGTATTDADAAASDIRAGKTAYVNGAKVTGNLTPPDTSGATAAAADILVGKTAYVNGAKLTGTIPSQAAQTITPGTADQTIAAGVYLAGEITIAGDADLVVSNIRKGATIFNKTGSYYGSKPFSVYKITSVSPLQGVEAIGYDNGTWTFCETSDDLSAGSVSGPALNRIYAADNKTLIGLYSIN